MDPKKVCKNIFFRSKYTILKPVLQKPFPRLKSGSKSQKIILQPPFNFEKYKLKMTSIEKIDVKFKLLKSLINNLIWFNGLTHLILFISRRRL